MRKIAFLLVFLGFCINQAHAAITIRGGKIYDADDLASLTVEEHYALANEAYQAENWSEAAKQYRIVAYNFPDTPEGEESKFFVGVAYFYDEDYDAANEEFSRYLRCHSHPKYFEQAIEYKFLVAEAFKCGARRRPFGYRKLPCILPGTETAIETYDQVIATVPCHDLAAQALFSKANLHWSCREYREAIECFQILIKRFPKHELTPDCYLSINRVYLEQSQREFQNPDILQFAQLNLRKFKQEFPGEERLCDAEADVLAIKEVYAKGLFDTGQFYERKNQPTASIIYYKKAIRQFPETSISQLCKERLVALGGECSENPA